MQLSNCRDATNRLLCCISADDNIECWISVGYKSSENGPYLVEIFNDATNKQALNYVQNINTRP